METNNNSTQAVNQNRPSENRPTAKSKKNALRRAITIAAVVALIVLGAIAALQLVAGDKPADDRYQAVFLSSGQVYFGKLKNTSGEYMTLEKSFYTKSSELPEAATAEQKAATANNVSLVKVGDEVYGPENTMKIRSEQVLFWQDLTKDSKVAKAIDSAK